MGSPVRSENGKALVDLTVAVVIDTVAAFHLHGIDVGVSVIAIGPQAIGAAAISVAVTIRAIGIAGAMARWPNRDWVLHAPFVAKRGYTPKAREQSQRQSETSIPTNGPAWRAHVVSTPKV